MRRHNLLTIGAVLRLPEGRAQPAGVPVVPPLLLAQADEVIE